MKIHRLEIVAAASLAVALAVALTAAPAAAQEGFAAIEAELETQLAEGRYSRALRTSRSALEGLVDTLPGTAEDAAPLARLLLLRAVAESRLDQDADALWSWAMAQGLDPAITGSDLGRFGRGALPMIDHPLRQRAEDGQLAGDQDGPPANLFEVTGDTAIVLPEPQRNRPPDYPEAARAAGVSGAVILQVMIDRNGRPYSPLVLESPAPVLSVAATEAVRDWRFKPARIDGREVAVAFNLRLDFRP